jgi:hypothetical protein
MITTELENPAKASAGVRTFVSTNANKQQSATISERILPQTSRAAVTIRIIIVAVIRNESYKNIKKLAGGHCVCKRKTFYLIFQIKIRQPSTFS